MLRRRLPVLPVLVVIAALAACHRPTASVTAGVDASGAAPASEFTAKANAEVAAALPKNDNADFDDARRGLLAGDGDVTISGPTPDSPPSWNTKDYAFEVGDEAPASVNPSLWRQARLNDIHGLFQVADGLYQVRGYDVSNLTLIRGESGWIVVDPLTAKETAAAALALARAKLGNAPFVAVIFTHSHIDHFGGIQAVLEDRYTDASKLRVIAPKGFLEEATSENVLAGLAMGRRAGYMYGTALPRTARGHVDTGLGKGPAAGTIAIVDPTEIVEHTAQTVEIDGVPFVFQYTPASEAPAELTFYLPKQKAFCGAEVVSHNLHNLYTLRGAKVRDALKWSGYIDEAIELFPDMELVFAGHHWPTFGHDRSVAYLKQQRDAYKYIHDQTLRMANDGMTPQEIAENIAMPSTLKDVFSVRDYYGTVRHNAKAVYQAYFGWYDGNPVNLNPLVPQVAAKKYIDAMGGAPVVIARAKEAFDKGDYRWASMLLGHAVFADENNVEARELLARSFEQMGYQAESGPWRDVYLSGAYELRHGVQPSPVKPAAMAGLLQHLDASRFFDAMAARVIGDKADGKTLKLNFVFTDLGETHVVDLENAVLHHHRRDADPTATATVHLTRDFLVRMSTGTAGPKDMIFSDELKVDGSRFDVLAFFSVLDRPDGKFPIVTP
jgi:alkyl sulfatase BDS1-like metallo-beta-lactamase superfamily hydrolase